MSTLRVLASAVALMVSIASVEPASAIVVNGDFNESAGQNYVGTAAAPDSGTVWNSIQFGTGTSGTLGTMSR